MSLTFSRRLIALKIKSLQNTQIGEVRGYLNLYKLNKHCWFSSFFWMN